MTLDSATNSFVLDISEFANQIYQRALMYEEKGSRQLQNDASDLIFKMVDDFITTQLLWARAKRASSDSRDLLGYERYGSKRRRATRYQIQLSRCDDLVDEFHHLLEKIPKRNELLTDMSDRLSVWILDHMDLPTWRIVHVTRIRNSVMVEIGEDYRIEEWTRDHGHEYGIRVD